MTAEDSPSPASSNDATTTISEEHRDPPSSPSISFDSAPESDVSAASSLLSDGSIEPDPEPVVYKKRRPPVRSWPASEEIALLEVVAAHRQKYGRLPSPDELAAALRGRIRAEDRRGAEQVFQRLKALRLRYLNNVLRLSRGQIPEKDDDVTIYKLSKLIWAGTRKGKQDKKTRAADAREDPRGFGKLTELYPCLSAEVEAIDAARGDGVLKRAFGRIGDDTGARLEARVKRQRVAEARASLKLDQLRTDVANVLLGFIE